LFLSPGRGQPVKTVCPEGVPLGVLPATEFAPRVEEISDGFQLLLYTDGLTEARNGRGEFFGQERLFRWFQRNVGRPADLLRDELALELENFQEGASLKDDQTFMFFGS
jgi:sigma-B regulation protein RsbU (phosphoserine phosphatase)